MKFGIDANVKEDARKPVATVKLAVLVRYLTSLSFLFLDLHP